MSLEDEKFFEELAEQKIAADENYRVELAKANTGIAHKSKSELKEQDAAASMDDGEPEGQLTIDVYQTPADIFVESAIAGVHPDEVDINVTSDSITIRGERHREKESEAEDYFYKECYWGRFSRSVILPQEVDPESASVTFKNGILKVKLPKLNKKKTRKLKVKVE
jgi:HSP20 family protein